MLKKKDIKMESLTGRFKKAILDSLQPGDKLVTAYAGMNDGYLRHVCSYGITKMGEHYVFNSMGEKFQTLELEEALDKLDKLYSETLELQGEEATGMIVWGFNRRDQFLDRGLSVDGQELELVAGTPVEFPSS